MNIDAFGAITGWQIDNHGSGYTSMPSLSVTSATCRCTGVAGTPPTSAAPHTLIIDHCALSVVMATLGCTEFRRGRP